MMYLKLVDPKSGKRMVLNGDAILMCLELDNGTTQVVTFSGATIVVPLAFDTIEEAIDAADDLGVPIDGAAG